MKPLLRSRSCTHPNARDAGTANIGMLLSDRSCAMLAVINQSTPISDYSLSPKSPVRINATNIRFEHGERVAERHT